MITKFFRGSLTGSDQADKSDLQTEMIFFTSSGRIGIIVDIQDSTLALHLSELQRNMSAALPPVGGTSHTRYRAPKDTRGSTDAEGAAFGFIDGDFLEHFPGLTRDARQKIMDGKSNPEKLKMSEHKILKILEQLQSLH
jgi:DNA damage-binding protein 1